MEPLKPGVAYHGRLADLPAGSRQQGPAARRVALYREERLTLLEADPALLQGRRVGELVTFMVDEAGRLAALSPEQGAGGAAFRPTGDALRWRGAGGAPARMTFLRWRHRILRELRAWFDEQGFLEVETPALVRAPSPEAVFTPIAAGEAFLITSPEFQLKRMLVGGFERIYRLGPVFRGGEQGALHNPEFTLLEWYRAHADTEALAADLAGLLGRLAPLASSFADHWSALGGDATARATAERLRRLGTLLGQTRLPRSPVGELFRRHLGMELRGVTTALALRAEALSAEPRGANVADAAGLPDDFIAAFSRLWLSVESRLEPDPLLVVDWPAPLASLARLKPDDAGLAERMELYAGGLELANGFAELTDPAEQRRRFMADLAARRAQGLPPVPLDEAFLAALEEGMPPAAGMALGVERLVMLLTGATRIAQVLPFAWEER